LTASVGFAEPRHSTRDPERPRTGTTPGSPRGPGPALASPAEGPQLQIWGTGFFVAIRDSEISAQSMGIHLAYYKTLSFMLSAALAGIGGSLYAHKMQFISPDQFNILQSVDLLLLVVIGGLGSIHGAFLGAIFLITMPQLISLGKDFLPAFIGQAPGLQGLVYGLVLIAFVMFEPMGLYGRWLKIRTWFQLFPFYRKGMFKRQKSFQKSDRLK
jgi:branched-chain amino acid transport system permease protein